MQTQFIKTTPAFAKNWEKRQSRDLNTMGDCLEAQQRKSFIKPKYKPPLVSNYNKISLLRNLCQQYLF
jgi:hypothetical protein